MPGLCRPINEGGIGFDYRRHGYTHFWIHIFVTRETKTAHSDFWNSLTNRRPDVKTVAYCESHDQALDGDKTIAFWLMDKYMYDHMHRDDEHLVIHRGMAFIR
jgi:1,4-alpha-glucan branching enzyme